jgi:hypothetical protein
LAVFFPSREKSIDDTYTTNPTGCINRVPPGLQAGGAWGTVKYFGDRHTAAILGHQLLCIVFACPQDEKDAYQINGRVSSKGERHLLYLDKKFAVFVFMFCFSLMCAHFHFCSFQNIQVYGADGKYIGSPNSTRFVPSE